MASNLKIHCNACMRETRHEEKRLFEQGGVSETTRWSILQCAGCDAVSFWEEHRIHDETGTRVIEAAVFPPRQYRKSKDYVGAPSNIDDVYRATVGAFNSSSSLFCASGMRVLVEGICAHQGILDGPKRDPKSGNRQYKKDGVTPVRGDSLDCKIEGLAEKGILTEAQARILHEHRFLGNMALHELNLPDIDTLNTALDLIEHIMDELYRIPLQAADLKLKRQSTSNKSPSVP